MNIHIVILSSFPSLLLNLKNVELDIAFPLGSFPIREPMVGVTLSKDTYLSVALNKVLGSTYLSGCQFPII